MNNTIQSNTELPSVNLLEAAPFLRDVALFVTASSHVTASKGTETRIAVRAPDGSIVAVEVWPESYAYVDEILEDLFTRLSTVLILPRSHFVHVLRPFAYVPGAATRDYPAIVAHSLAKQAGNYATA